MLNGPRATTASDTHATRAEWPSRISVVVPVFNSAETLPDLITRLDVVLPRVAPQFEVILVNDGSTDNTMAAIEVLLGKFPYVRGVDLMRNYGQHNAILCGVRLAEGDVVITIDDDLQNPPEEIPRLITKLAEGYDVVYGTPTAQQHELWRVLASWITRLALQQVLGAETARHVSAFRAIRTSVRDVFIDYRSSFVSIDALLAWGSTRFAAIPVVHAPRAAGVSHYTLRKLVSHSLNMVTGFSTTPLQAASLLGFPATAGGFCILLYVLGRSHQGTSVPGFPFLASLISIFSGVQLFTIGVIGEYLARMHLECWIALLTQFDAWSRRASSREPMAGGCQYLDWDSTFFGIRIGRIRRSTSILCWSRRSGSGLPATASPASTSSPTRIIAQRPTSRTNTGFI